MKEIPLTQGKVALVDDEDYEWLNRWKWTFQECKSGNGYAVRYSRGRREYMHRLVLNAPTGTEIDHVATGDTLNNQRTNLRVCTRAQNLANRNIGKNNTSGYKGVRKLSTGRFTAQV